MPFTLGAKADAPYIVGEYGKIEDEWIGFPGYSETVLWSGTETISAWANPFTIPDISLSVLDDYDAFSFEAELTEDGGFYPYNGILLASYIKNNIGNYIQIPIMIAHSHQMNIYPDQTNNCFKMYAETNYSYRFKRLVGIKYGYSSKVDVGHNYSTDEKVVGTWIDGSTLYEKTIEYTVTNQAASGAFDITTDVPITNKVIKCSCIFDYEYQGVSYSLVDSSAHYYNGVGNSNTIKFNMGSGTISGNLTVTVQYTKTTS